MIENVVRSIGGVGSFGVISICIFFLFFIGMHLWTFRLKKPYLNSMSGLPLEGESALETPAETNREKSHE
jgi:hypothetical protein